MLFLQAAPAVVAMVRDIDSSLGLRMRFAKSGSPRRPPPVGSTLLAVAAEGVPTDCGPAGGAGEPLHLAAYKGHLAVAAHLAARGAEATVADKDGTRPLHHTAFNGHLAVAAFLAAPGTEALAAAVRSQKGVR